MYFVCAFLNGKVNDEREKAVLAGSARGEDEASLAS